LNDLSSVEPNRVGIKHSPITGELFSSVSQICAGIVIFYPLSLKRKAITNMIIRMPKIISPATFESSILDATIPAKKAADINTLYQ